MTRRRKGTAGGDAAQDTPARTKGRTGRSARAKGAKAATAGKGTSAGTGTKPASDGAAKPAAARASGASEATLAKTPGPEASSPPPSGSRKRASAAAPRATPARSAGPCAARGETAGPAGPGARLRGAFARTRRGLARLLRGPEGAPIAPPSGWSAWIVPLTAGAMAFLAVLTVAAGLAAGALAQSWRADLADSATVRLPPGTAEASVERVLSILRATPGVAGARVLGAEEQAALLEPWLGPGAAELGELPLPVLVDVDLRAEGPDGEGLAGTLALTVEGAVWDDHRRLAGPLARTADEIGRLAFAGAALVLLAAGGMVALAARASLAANAETVRVVRLIGGEDGFITAAFMSRLMRRLAAGTLAGALGGALVLAGLPQIGAGTALALPVLPGPAGLAAVSAAVALLLVAIGWLAARVTLRLALDAMP